MHRQPSNRKKIFVTVALVLLFVVFINLPVVRKAAPSRISRRLILNTIYPFQYAFSAVFSKVAQSISTVVTLWSASSENKKLKEEIALLRARTNILQEAASENTSLRESLRFKTSNPYGFKLIAAEVISRSPSNWFETVFINKGAKDGLTPDQAVICKDGVVGRTVEVGRFSSKVMLITDPESSIGVMKKGSKDLGIAVGGAMNYLQIKYVAAASTVDTGDKMLTSGMGEVFPRGIPVGVVTKASARDYDIFKYVELKPLTDFARLNKVFVVIR